MEPEALNQEINWGQIFPCIDSLSYAGDQGHYDGPNSIFLSEAGNRGNIGWQLQGNGSPRNLN